MLYRLISGDRGATALEYALMVSLIALAIIAAVALLGGNLANFFNNAATQVTTP